MSSSENRAEIVTLRLTVSDSGCSGSNSDRSSVVSQNSASSAPLFFVTVTPPSR